jgi:hypothetical protein
MATFARPFASLIVSALALAAPIFAQTATPAQQLENKIEAELRSGDLRLTAWGAHDALAADDQNLVPELISLANSWSPLSRPRFSPFWRDGAPQPSSADERDAMAAVLDALIRMHADLPSDTLLNLAADFGNDVAVFLSRLPLSDMQTLSFELYRHPSEHSHGLEYVSAALLAQHPVPGFAADLLSKISIRATVFVTLPGTPPFGGGSAGDCASEPDQPRQGWPMTGQYSLTKEKIDGAILVVGGSEPVYAIRKLSTHYTSESCAAGVGIYLGPEERLGLIAEMLGSSRDAIPWRTDLQTQIDFESPEQFDRGLLAFAQQEQQKHRATVAALAAHGLLTESEAADSLPELQLNLEDMRGQGFASLEPPSNLPSHVQCSLAP